MAYRIMFQFLFCFQWTKDNTLRSDIANFLAKKNLLSKTFKVLISKVPRLKYNSLHVHIINKD
jgi:hypothetical protein